MSAPDELRTTPKDLIPPAGHGYSDVLAAATADHAVAAYLHPNDYIPLVLEAGFQGGAMLERGAAQVALAYSPEVVVCSPRGSHESLDWVHDALSVVRRGWRPHLPPGASIGLGLWRQSSLILKPLQETLCSILLRNPGARLVWGAHSLGAGITPILVAVLYGMGIQSDAAYLHATPRSGNKVFGDWYDSKFTMGLTPTWNVANTFRGELDPVTRVPKHGWGFRHVGFRAIHADGDVLFGDDAWQEYRRRNPVGFWRATRLITRRVRALRAHGSRRARDLYLERIGRTGGTVT